MKVLAAHIKSQVACEDRFVADEQTIDILRDYLQQSLLPGGLLTGASLISCNPESYISCGCP